MVKFSPSVTFLLALICVLPLTVHSGGDECSEQDPGTNKTEARKLNIAAIFIILAAGALGCSIPALGHWFPALSPEKDYFSLIKSFAAGVILTTGFIHILPDANEQLTSSCLPSFPWQNFPFAFFIAMLGATGTLAMETATTIYFSRRHTKKETSAVNDLESNVKVEKGNANHVYKHTYASHGHAHGVAMIIDSMITSDEDSQLIRNRVISKVLELGIIVHSVIIGMSLGASKTPSTIRPLIAALSFHQCFEGLGLGSSIAQAKLHLKSVVIMSIVFSTTTPLGIAIGLGIASSYNENSPTALIVEGLLDSIAAGILIYMSLVDLLSKDFMNPLKQSQAGLLFLMFIFLLFGIGLMSMLAIWA